MSLQNLQLEFAEIIFSENQATDIILPCKNMAIYQNNVVSTLIRALEEAYPLMTQLLGKDFFRQSAKEYIKQYPSCSSNLHDYGEYLSDFLYDYPPVQSLPYLSEVAQFEWACHTLFFAADHAAFDPTLLQKITPNQFHQLHFTLHPASRLMNCHYPILHIIDLCKGNTNETLDLNKGGIHLLIIRRDLDLTLVTLTAGEFTFLTAINQNKTLSQALNDTLIIDAEFKLEEKLATWIQDKTIVDCYLDAK